MLRLDEWRATENIPRIVLFFNTPRDGNRYKPQGVQLVPVNLSWLQLLRETPWESSTLPTFDMPWGDLFSDLIQEYLYVAVYRAFAASLSAENSSRLASMESAEQNIAERLDDLEQQYHQVRQHSITSELLDIIAGAEAARRKM